MLKINSVNKYFNKGHKNQIHVINNTTLDLGNNGLVALLGPSGCGKTTLLNVIGGLDKIKNGSIYVNDEKINSFSTRKVDKIRNLNIGYIFQDYKLLDDLTVYENIAISLKTIGIKDKNEIDKRIDYVLDRMKMLRYKKRPCSMLSGGERQRVGIARALVKNPNIILADEPTGNLDSKNSLEIMNIIKAISKERLVILVTHEEDLAHFFADRIIEIKDGQVVNDYANDNANDLDYKMENIFYLKDFKYTDSIENNECKIDIYGDKKTKVNIELIFRNGNIYLRNNTKEKVIAIDDDSNIEIINDHYREYTKKEAENYEFKLNDVIDHQQKLRYSSIFRLFNFISAGFKKVFSFSVLKKILLIGFFISAMFIMYAYSSVFASLNIKDSDFVKINRHYLTITSNKNKVEDYLNLIKNEEINYILPGNSIVNFKVKYKDYYQTSMLEDTLYGSLSSIKMINSSDLTYGRMPENDREIVVDELSLKKMFVNNYATMSGVFNYEDMLDRNALIGEFLTFKIVGIVSFENPSIYVDETMFMDIIANSNQDDGFYNNYDYKVDVSMVSLSEEPAKFINYKLFEKEIKLKKGRMPVNNYEVILNTSYQDLYKINKNTNIKINNKKLKVVGFYTSKEDYDYYLVNDEMILYQTILTKENLTIYSKDKALTLKKLREIDYNIDDSYTKSKNDYIRSNREGIKSTLITASIILFISLFEIFLMIRSSFLSRVKEVGILRAIGIKKMDIYKMFLGEILAITIMLSVPGIMFMAYILSKISTISYLSRMYLVNTYSVLLAIVTVFIFNVIIGLLPVYKTIRKRPSEILSRNDLD